MHAPDSQNIMTTASAGEVYLVSTCGERYLYTVNRQAFANCASAVVYQTHFGNELLGENTLYVIVGTDGGLLPEYLTRKQPPAGSRYIFIELPEFIAQVRERLGHHGAQAISICSPEEWPDALRDSQFPDYAYRSAVILLQSLGVADNCYSGYRPVWREVESTLRQQLWEYSVQLSTRVFVRRQIENMAENMTPAARLRKAFSGATVAILAGGPSLTAALPWVLANRDNLVVIAVSRISRLLQAVSLTPDIVVSVDPNPISFDVSREMLDFKDTLLVNGYHITPLLLGNFGGQCVYTDSALPWAEAEDNIKSVGPTVTNTAVHLAQDMGCAQIVLLGVDLCYSPEGYTHALGSIEHAAGPLVGYIGQTVSTNAGDRAETDPPFLHATKALALQAQRAATLGCRMINPAASAAAIPGIEFVSLDSLVLQPLPQPARDTIRRAVPPMTTEQRTTHYRGCLSEIKRANYKVDCVLRLIRKALDLNGRFWKHRDIRSKHKLDKIEKELNAAPLLHYSRLCKVFASEKFARILTPSDSSTWTEKFTEDNCRDYYEAYRFGAEAMRKILNDAHARLLTRIEEQSSTPDWEVLAKQWRHDNNCGRVRFVAAGTEHAPAVEDKPLVTELEEDFARQLTNTDNRHFNTCLQRGRLQGVIGKANEHLESGDQTALERLINGLSLRSEPEALPLQALCEGYLAELNNDGNSAIAAYGRIDSGPAVEYALLRITGMALANEDYVSAQMALEHLSNFSPVYGPQYAEILRINGDTSKAIDVYTDYLSLVPTDLIAMTKLGTLYRNLGITEGAEWIFRHLATQTESRAPLESTTVAAVMQQS